MQSALLQSYGPRGQFGQGIQTPERDDLSGRMSKRRRVGEVGQGVGVHNYDQWQPPYGDVSLETPYTDAKPGAHQSAEQYSTVPSGAYQPRGTPTTHATAQTVQWQAPYSTANSEGYIAPYQDLSSYQPYYYGQTDPSVYNSPWPPQQPEPQNAAHTPTSAFSMVQPSAVPYAAAPSHRSMPSSESFETGSTPAFAQFENLDLSQFGNTQNMSQQQQQQQPARQARVPSATYFDDASMHLKMQSLQILDNLATQLIQTIAKYSFSQIQDLMRNSEDEDSQAYITLKNLFDQTRKVYCRETPFIDAIGCHMFQPNQQEVIRKANIATFVSSIFGAHDVSFHHLNHFYLEIFVPMGHRLLKWQGVVYLELKTQTYISTLMNSDRSPELILSEIFPQDLDAQILSRHPDAPSLSPSEQDFVDRAKQRRSYLLAGPAAEEAIDQLPKRYQWSDFMREFATCIGKNVDTILSVPTRAQPAFNGMSDRRAVQAPALQDSMNVLNSQASQCSTPPSAGLVKPNPGATQPPATSQPTAKASTPTSTVRQPWTKPEEDALMAGLEKVNGPHWSQILALFGRGGSVNEVLKDRNQVQLKDKARNLKLWYLKTGKEVPVSLRGVTGELRKRGGARARAALAAEESAEDAMSEGRSTPGIVSAKKKGKAKG